jgi:hypothetical protein
MKATARVITRSVRAGAIPIGGIAATGVGMPTGILAKAAPTDKTGMMAFLYVEPEQPQSLVWLVQQVGIDYNVIASRNTNWKVE